MLKTFLFFAIFLLARNMHAQTIHVHVYYSHKANKANSDTVYYSPERKLSWGDFKGTPDPNHFGGAVTASGFAYNADMEYDRDNITINVYVYTFFTKHDSWKKPQINGAYHLEHEQHHFDITYLGALKFVEALKKATYTTHNFKKLPEQIFNKAYDENTAMQHQYDRETKHSIDATAQEAWNKKINEMLQSSSLLSQRQL